MGFKVPEKFRDREFSSEKCGNNGFFRIPRDSARNSLFVVASDGAGWEHVSVSKKYECPTWDEMCLVKGLFWDDEDCVVQFHPPKSCYINHWPYCLHMWRNSEGKEMPMPPTWMV